MHAFLKQHRDIMEGYKRGMHSLEESKYSEELGEKTTQVQRASGEDIKRKSDNG